MLADLDEFYLNKVERVDFNEGIATVEDLKELNDKCGKALRYDRQADRKRFLKPTL